MIVCIDIKDNDFGEIIEQYMSNFSRNLLFDLHILCEQVKAAERMNKKASDLDRVFVDYYESFEKINEILNPNIDIKMDLPTKEYLTQRIKVSLEMYLTKKSKLEKDTIDYIIKRLSVSYPKHFVDKYENGEKFYYFEHSGVVVNQ